MSLVKFFFNELIVLECRLSIYLVDFGDTSYSYYVFELAIAMAYMLLQSKELLTGGLVIAGYSMMRNIPEDERKVLKV